MPKPSASERLRVKLRGLLRERGTAAHLARYAGKPPSLISMFLTGARPTAIHLDDLDDLSAYFRLSIGELLGAAKPGELSGDEQRLVHAFRVLPTAARDHFLAVLEQMSVHVASVDAQRKGRPPMALAVADRFLHLTPMQQRALLLSLDALEESDIRQTERQKI